jgi:hypothetical protein
VPVPDGGRGQRAERKRAANHKRAAEALLVGVSDPIHPAKFLRPGASSAESRTVEAMWARCRVREGRANLEAKEKRVGTSLGKFELLLECLPSLAQFRPLRFEGDLDTSEHNEGLLCILADFIRSKPKSRVGELVKADTVSGQVSGIKAIVEEHLGRRIICSTGGFLLKRVLQSMRREDGPAGERRLSAPFGNAHLSALARADCPYDTGSDDWTCVRWALLQCMLHCLLRGGEPGTQPRHAFRPATGLCWCHFVWLDPATRRVATIRGADGRLYYLLIVRVLPIKDQTGRAKRVPIPVRSKHPVDHPLSDVTCPYYAIARAWQRRAASVPQRERASTAFFQLPSGKVVDTDLVRAVVREAATCLGLDAGVFGASAPRRGGGTDLRDQLGSDRGAALIRQRGRWCNSDMPDIYARASAREHAEASAAIGQAAALTLEQLDPAWVQPTRF